MGFAPSDKRCACYEYQYPILLSRDRTSLLYLLTSPYVMVDTLLYNFFRDHSQNTLEFHYLQTDSDTHADKVPERLSRENSKALPFFGYLWT